MKVLLISCYFPPEIGSGPHLPYELGESLVHKGHEVTVVTGFPRYNVPVLPECYRDKTLVREKTGGMTVLRMRAPIPYGKGTIDRGLFHLLSPLLLAVRSLPLERPDVVYSFTPPLPMGIVARAVASRFRVPCLVNVQDLFPQNAIDLGLLRNTTIIRLFQAMERCVYRWADCITVMSDGNGDRVVARGAPRDRVHTVFNWVDTELIHPGERLNAFRQENGIGSQFVVLFAGTMGWSQGLDVVVEAARRLAKVPELVFLMVGGGVERDRLERQAAGLPNIRFLPMQPKKVYPQVLAASDACLVTLRPEVATPTVPSKIATIMAAGRPILASLPDGDAPQLIRETGTGEVVPAGDADALAAAVLRFKENPHLAQQAGCAGRVYAESQLSRTVCVSRIETLLQRVIESKRRRSTLWLPRSFLKLARQSKKQ